MGHAMTERLTARGRHFAESPFHVWGIVNVTPDSFSDGGRFMQLSSALERARQLLADGADVLDVGGASSRPGAVFPSEQEELERVRPVLKSLASGRDGAGRSAGRFISIDTWRAGVARAALEAGADIVNDISACAWDQGLIDVVAQYSPGYVLTHCPARPDEMVPQACDDIWQELLRFFENRLAYLVRNGVPEENILLDPGIGFGKTAEQNWQILRGIGRLRTFGRPVLAGISRKRFLGAVTGVAPGDRDSVTAACSALLWERGVRHHRVHDAARAAEALRAAVLFRD